MTNRESEKHHTLSPHTDVRIVRFHQNLHGGRGGLCHHFSPQTFRVPSIDYLMMTDFFIHACFCMFIKIFHLPSSEVLSIRLKCSNVPSLRSLLVDTFSTGWRQEGHPATKTLYHLPLIECTFSPLLFHQCHLFLSEKDGEVTGHFPLDITPQVQVPPFSGKAG